MIAESVTFAGIIDDAFNQIRQYSQPDVAVQIRLLEAITRIAAYTHNAKDRDILKCHADMINRHCLEQVSEQRDRNSIDHQYQAALKALEIPKQQLTPYFNNKSA